MGESDQTAPPHPYVNISVSSCQSNILQVDGVNNLDSSNSSQDDLSDSEDSDVTG